MSDIKYLKAENRRMAKQLKGENLKLFGDIEVYMNDSDINQENSIQIKNQILTEFVQISNEGKNVWDTIGSPHEYCDKYLINYEKKDTSTLSLIRKYIPIVMFLLSGYFLMENYFSAYQREYIDPSLVQVTSLNLMKYISYSTFYFFMTMNDKNKIFIRNRSMRAGSFKFLFIWLIINVVGMSLTNGLFEFTIPKIFLYIVLLISLSLIFYNRKLSKNA